MSKTRTVGVSFLFDICAIAISLASVLLLGSVPARSATIINISAAISIPENTTMNLGHTLTNKESSSYLFGNFTGLTFKPINKDPDDKVTDVTITANACSGTFVLPGKTCTFAFHIMTADSTATTGDVGTWTITAQVEATWFDINTNKFQTDTFKFNDTVTVLDPVPLPAALALFATGLGALGLLGWRRKRRAAIGADPMR